MIQLSVFIFFSIKGSLLPDKCWPIDIIPTDLFLQPQDKAINASLGVAYHSSKTYNQYICKFVPFHSGSDYPKR